MGSGLGETLSPESADCTLQLLRPIYHFSNRAETPYWVIAKLFFFCWSVLFEMDAQVAQATAIMYPTMHNSSKLNVVYWGVINERNLPKLTV